MSNRRKLPNAADDRPSCDFCMAASLDREATVRGKTRDQLLEHLAEVWRYLDAHPDMRHDQ